MSEKFCQSCGMPMGNTDELYGLNEDGSKSRDYCKYCFVDGKFTVDVTMEGMIEICVGPMLSMNEGMSEDEARGMMNKAFPTLKRWK